MVKKRKKGITKKGTGKGFNERPQDARTTGASTIYGTCSERLSPFGGLLIKFLDLMKFEEIFDHTYKSPEREPKLGHYRGGFRHEPQPSFYISRAQTGGRP